MEHNSQHQLVERFTDDIYARKEDVRKALNTSLIDPIWAKILDYRRNYYKKLNITDIAKRNYFICYVAKISDTCSEVLNKINQGQQIYMALDENMKKALKEDNDALIINGVNQLYSDKEVKNDFIAIIRQGKSDALQGLSLDKMKVINYYNLLNSLKHEDKADEDYLISLYSRLSKNSNLVRLYRDFDFAGSNIYAINQERNGVSHHQIERMMGELYNYVADESELAIIRAAMGYYYLNYVKPFDAYNQEIALLFFKQILSYAIGDNYPFLLPLEKSFYVHNAFIYENKEAEKNNDFTYFLLKVITLLNETLVSFNQKAEKIHIDALTKEHDLKPSDLLKEINQVEVKPTVEIVKSEEEKITPPIIAPKVNEEKVVNIVKKEKTVPIFDNTKINEDVNLTAIVNIDEKDANRFAKYLLEKNPLLKKKEAHFYARHSTLGSYYTIQMYKNFEHVVYETARTSMDSLVKFGYYRKEQIKNKFVYTPNKIEGK